MAWGTTKVVTINSIAMTLNRVNNDNHGSDWEYYGATESLVMRIRHSVDAPRKDTGVVNRRHFLDITHTIYATSTVAQIVRTWGYTIVHPKNDDPAAALLDLAGFSSALVGTTPHTDMLAGLN